VAEDKNNEEEKFDFTPEGESVEYISLGDARVMAIRHAQDNLEIYGLDYQDIRLVSELVSAVEEEDYYDIRLSFRPVGRLDGSPGLEQFIISKTGTIEVRQLLEFPTQQTGTASRTTSAPTPPRVPPGAPVASESSSGGIPRWLLFGGLGAAAIAVVAIVISLVAIGDSGSSLAPSPTPTTIQTYIPYETPTPSQSSTPEPLPPTPAPKLTSPASTPTSSQTATTLKKNREIVFGGLNWDSALIQNGVARYIVEHGYGYPTSQIEGATLPLFMGLRKGDIDVAMEIWLPNQDTAWNEAVKAGEVIPAGKSLEDNWQSSFLIPKYLQDANPELDSIEDLKSDRYKMLFEQEGGKVVLWGCIAGWGCRVMQDGDETGPGQIVGMGLEDHVVLRDPGTAGALAAAIQSAFARKDPILFYYWGPTALTHKLAGQIVDLEQPAPSECAWNSPIHGCAFPAAEIMIALNTELLEDAPELITFFKNWDWSAGNQLAAEGWFADNKEGLGNRGMTSEEIYSATGVWYLQNNDAWKRWVPDDVAGNVLESLSNR
jgi:glycine betaine/proline transport system substrate-binding protein